MLVPEGTGSERVLAPGVDVVLEEVRMAVNKRFPTLMPTFCPGSMATGPNPHASLDAMWKVFNDSPHIKTPAVNGENFGSLPVSSTGAQSSARRGRCPPVMDAAKAECRYSRLHGRRDRAIILLLSLSMTPLTLVLTICPTAGH